MRRRDVVILAGVGIAAGAAGVVFGPIALQSQSGAAELLAVRYPDLSGKGRQLLEWRGRVLVCNFWATWCEPCREEIPMLRAVRAQYGAKGCEVVGIGIDQAAKIEKFAKEYQVEYPLLVADASALDIMRVLGNRAAALPFTVVLDRQGAIQYRKLGLLQRAEVDRALGQLLG